MWTALIWVVPRVSVGSVQVNTASPFRDLSEAIANRNSVMCVAFSTVVPATRGLSVKLPVVVLVLESVAVTVEPALTAAVQERVPAQPPPLQPVKVEPAADVAVNVTKEPAANEAEHVAPHEMPAGALVTVPVPVPDLLTVSVTDCSAKVAVTELAALIVTMQPPLPEQPPLHQAKLEPASGVTVKVTAVPLGNEAAHVAPQTMPAGELVMVPVPVPDLLTVSVKPCCSLKVAVMEVAAVSVTIQGPVLEQAAPGP